MYKSDDLVGITVSFFVIKRMSNKIHDIATSKLKFGFSGKMGNKGAVLLRFKIDDSSFCFVSCHLESGNGPNEIKRREESLASIYENGFINERGTY